MAEDWDWDGQGGDEPAQVWSPSSTGAGRTARTGKLQPIDDSPIADSTSRALDSTFFFSNLSATEGDRPRTPVSKALGEWQDELEDVEEAEVEDPVFTSPPQIRTGGSDSSSGSSKKGPELVRATYMLAAAEAEAEENEDEIRRLEAEGEGLRASQLRLVEEKAALEEELRLVRRELDSAKRERDDAIGERFVLQKEMQQAAVVVGGREGSRDRTRSPASPLGNRRLEEELIEAKLALAEALGRNDVLEKGKQEVESQLVEVKYELAHYRSSKEDMSAELDRLVHENQMLRRELAKVMGRQRKEKEQQPPASQFLSSTRSPVVSPDKAGRKSSTGR